MLNANFSCERCLRGFVCLGMMLGGFSSMGFAQQASSDSQVISFEATGEAKSAGNEPAISFQLQNAPWEFVLREFGRKAGYTLQMLDIPPGTLTYSDKKTYAPEEALDILHGYLLQEGFVMVKRDRFLVVLNIDKRPIPPNLIPNVAAEDLEKRGRNELVNVVLPLQNAEAEDVGEEVEALLGPQGKVVPLPTSNAIVVTDTAATLVRVRRLVENIAAGEEDLKFKSFGLKHINAEDAAYLVQSQLGVGTGVTNVSAAQEYDRSRDSRYRGPSSSSRSSSSQTAKAGTQVTPDLRTNSLLVTATTETLGLVEEMIASIDVGENADGQAFSAGRGKPYLKVYSLESADAREVAKTLDAVRPGVVINEDGRARRIHIKATESEHKEIEEIIRQLDGAGGGTQQVAVIPLADLDPLGAAATLRSLFVSDGDAAPIIEADTYGMRLMVRGTFDQVTQVKTLLAQLGEDGTGQSAGTSRGGTVRNIPLGGRNAQRFVDLLEREWSRSKSSSVRIVVPSRSGPIGDRLVPGRSTMRSDDESLDDIQSRRRKSDTVSPRKRPTQDELLPVNFQDTPAKAESTAEPAKGPAEIVVYADGMLSFNGETVTAIDELKTSLQNWQSRSGDAKVRVVVDPKAPAPALSAVFATAQEAGSEIDLRSEKTTPPEPAVSPKETVTVSSEQPTEPPTESARETEATDDAKDDVTVIVRDDQLVLLSDNEDALDQMEEMIGDLAQAVPPETTWTVFYLRVADATTTAAMLEQLFPSSSIGTAAIAGEQSLMGSLTGGLSSLGGGLMDMAGLSGLGGPQTLRIIPDLRSNSLFVTGPTGQVRDVEQMLKILDSDEVPESLRERLPRMIPVDHASVTEVAEILKEVYKDYLEDPNARNNGRNNPLAMMMGGGGRSSGGSSSPGIRMTIGVDARTSTLVVSANDTLFRQVEALVEELDNSAFEAHETIRVVPVGEADAAIVQAALTSLIPSVKVSTTNSGAKPSSPSSNSSNDSNRDDNVRQFFEQRMRERAAEQSRGGSTRGGAPSGGRSGFPFGGGDRGGSSRRGFGGGGSSRRGR
ncbi:secretin N-terminal domain-containing protein [Thalassoroseus pseudoceratinae]|uniref:secretin N-terminal domain-containing protein n=1 Tax=Thalassoroseus pseudoceratinae TaxID=2713176 RepID=UPI001420CBFE|nr:secretin N-terminal domain-containing protein [Thalassoroseus pseudoceratinae]